MLGTDGFGRSDTREVSQSCVCFERKKKGVGGGNGPKRDRHRLEREGSGQNLRISNSKTRLETFGNLTVQNRTASSSRWPWVRRRPWRNQHQSSGTLSMNRLFEGITRSIM